MHLEMTPTVIETDFNVSAFYVSIKKFLSPPQKNL